MVQRLADGQVLVFAPGVDNAGMIARRLRDGGLACIVCADLEGFEAVLMDQSERLGAIVVTSLGVRRGAGPVVSRFKADEPAWSALPIVLMAPPGGIVVPPWSHTTLLTQQTTAKQLVDVVGRSVQARGHQHLLASASRDLHRAALQDALTGLPNRSAIYERIRELQADRRGAVLGFAALFLDLDGFKAINDTHGHIVGDEVLRRIGAHLVASVRSTDFVGRWGGDEFIVLLVGAIGENLIADTVRRLGAHLDLQLQSTSESVRASFSVGILDDVPIGATPDEILSQADERMYEHKRQRRRSDPP